GGRARFIDEETESEVVLDSLWIIILSGFGYFGLAALGAILLIPPLRFLQIHRPATWLTPANAPAAVAAVVLSLFVLDCLFNAMYNPMYVLLTGALTELNASDARYVRQYRATAAQAAASNSA